MRFRMYLRALKGGRVPRNMVPDINTRVGPGILSNLAQDSEAVSSNTTPDLAHAEENFRVMGQSAIQTTMQAVSRSLVPSQSEK